VDTSSAPSELPVPDVPGLVERLEATEALDATAEALWEVLPDWVVTGWGRGRRRRGGVVLGLLGGLAAIASGYLGGHLTTTRAVTRDNRLLDAPANRPSPHSDDR